MGMASPEADAGVADRARSAIEIVGLVIAPTTLVTALAFYFGWVQTNARSAYFGIDASTLGYSTQDYVLRSANVLFVPIGLLLVVALGALFVHGFATPRLADPRIRLAARAAVVAGAVLFAVGVVAILRPLSFSPPYLLATAGPGLGIALLSYGRHLLARTAPSGPARTPGAVTALVVLVIVLSAFASAAQYADALGRHRAADINLESRPRVTVFAPKALDIQGPGVTTRRLTGAYGYRYDGLRLLVRSDDKYFLLPDGWTRASGTAIVLADDPGYRFEFAPGGGSDRPAANAAAAVVPEPILAGPPLMFAARVGRTQSIRVVIASGDEVRTVRGYELSGNRRSAFRLSAGTCKAGTRLPAGGDCEMPVTFAARAKGTRTAKLVVDLEPGPDDRTTLVGEGR